MVDGKELGRDGRTGRYTETKLEALCRCGDRLGVHTAASVDGKRPCLEVGCRCEKFTKVRKEKG